MLNELCLQGAFPNTFIYHICGLPWASTNDVDFYRWINSTGSDTERDTLKLRLFGADGDNVQVLLNLRENLGGQSVNYGEDKGITVGGWSVSVEGGANGFNWNNHSDMEQWGVIGLDWQPVEDTDGACVTLIITDIKPNLSSSNAVTVTWLANKDIGSVKLVDWLDDNWNGSSYDNDLFLYCSSSCIRPTAEVVDNLDGTYSVDCQSGKMNAPCEDILALQNRQQIYLTNYPQGIEGLTANLYAVSYANNVLISGTDPYLMRTGKIKNNATQDNQGNWQISMGGFTDQLKFKNTIGQFTGGLSGFYFNKKDDLSVAGKENYHTPFLYVQEFVKESAVSGSIVFDTVREVLDISSDYEEFTSAGDIIDSILSKLNNSSNLYSKYKLGTDGDIVIGGIKDTDYAVISTFLSGTAPYVAGVGYIPADVHITAYMSVMTDPINANICPASDTVDGTYGRNLVSLRTYENTEPTQGLWAPGSNLINLKATPLEYFIQTDLSQARRSKTDLEFFEDKTNYPIAEDSSGNQDLTINTFGDSEISVTSGMLLHFGDFGEEGSGLAVAGEVDTVSGNQITFVDDSITGLPMSMYNNSSFANKIGDKNFLFKVLEYCTASGTAFADVLDMFSKDPFTIKDATVITVDEAVDVFKGILGDPDTDIGLNLGAVKTDIKNLFDRGDFVFTPIVNWDKFQDLVDANTIEGIEFTYTPDSNGGVDVLKLLVNICLTFNIQMIWEYNPTGRSWWLNFDEFGEGNIANATTNARVIKEGDISTNELSAIVGGGWYYSKLSGNYKSVRGNDIELHYQLTDGRIGHSLKDKVLSIDDKITQLPIENKSTREEIITRYSTMLRLFSQVVYKQKLVLNLRKSAILGVGRYHTAEWAPIQNRQTGKRNDGKLIGQIQSENINLTSGIIDVDLLSYPSNKLGIAPTMYADAVSKSSDTVTISGLSTDPLDNDFGDTDGLLTDQMYFQCIDEVSGTLTDRQCDCDGYRVTIFERKPTDNKLYFDPLYAYASQNVFRGTMEKLDVSSIGTSVDIVLDGNGTAFDTTSDWIVTFADRADSDLCSCQTDLYGWLGDENNQVTDSDTNTSKGITVGN